MACNKAALFISLVFLHLYVLLNLYCKLLIRVRKNLRAHVGDVDAGAVPCGFGRAIGNKVIVIGFLVLICCV